jgi:hypothetical protein
MRLTLTLSALHVSCLQLNLFNNSIGSEGAKALADALKVNTFELEASLTQVLAFCQHLSNRPPEPFLQYFIR